MYSCVMSIYIFSTIARFRFSEDTSTLLLDANLLSNRAKLQRCTMCHCVDGGTDIFDIDLILNKFHNKQGGLRAYDVDDWDNM